MVQQHFSGRTRLLQAAEICFRHAPYAGVGVAAILAEAGVRAPSMYHHFDDKEALYAEWAEGALSSVAYTFDSTSCGTFRYELQSFAQHMLERVDFDVPQAVKDMATLEREESQQRIYSAYAQSIYEPLCGIFFFAIDHSEARLEPVGRLADMFLAGIWTLRGPKGTEAELARWWVTLFLNGIGTGL